MAVYIDVSPATNQVTLSMLLSGTATSRSWLINVAQIPCGTIYTGTSTVPRRCRRRSQSRLECFWLLSVRFCLQRRTTVCSGSPMRSAPSPRSTTCTRRRRWCSTWPTRTTPFASAPTKYTIRRLFFHTGSFWIGCVSANDGGGGGHSHARERAPNLMNFCLAVEWLWKTALWCLVGRSKVGPIVPSEPTRCVVVVDRDSAASATQFVTPRCRTPASSLCR